MSRFRILTSDDLPSVFGRQFESITSVQRPSDPITEFSLKTFSVGLVRGAPPPVFNLPATRASVVRSFSGGLLFAGGVNGGDLFHVPTPHDIGDDAKTTYLGNLVPPADRIIDARYGVYDLAILQDDGELVRFVFSYPRRNLDSSLQVIFKEATIGKVGGGFSLDVSSISLWYESQPPVFTDGVHHGSGKMAVLDGNSVYASVGDLGSGLVGQRLETPGIEGDLGHVLLLTPTTRQDVSKGHRNIQGMVYVDNGPRLFATEHGPQGGDELNLIDLNEVKDYGWPYVSLGDPYDSTLIGDADPRNYVTIGQTNTHAGYEAPIFSWNPSIAPTEIVYVPQLDLFFMGTLRQKTIYSFRISPDNVLSRLRSRVVGVRVRSLAVYSQQEGERQLLGSSDEGKVVLIQL